MKLNLLDRIRGFGFGGSGSPSFGAGLSAAGPMVGQQFQYAYPSPGNVNYTGGLTRRLAHYGLLWAAFLNTAFIETYIWEAYLEQRNLYKRTVCVYNPVRRLVDFYIAHIYPGFLTPDGLPLDKNVPLAIPISVDIPDTDDKLRNAIGQLWQWSNWQQVMGLWIMYCAALGDGPVEIVDDVENGLVYATPIWPGHITDVTFDLRGNVIEYVKDLLVWDNINKEYYRYQRIVTKDKIGTYRDGTPFSYLGNPPEYDNPYGFVPLVWCSHYPYGVGELPGGPAIRDWRKVEQLNSDISQLRAYIRRQGSSPQILTGMGEVRPPNLKIDGREIDPEDLLLLVAEKPGEVREIKGNLQIDMALKLIEMQIAEIEKDHPEIVMYHYLRQMSQVTGPAAARLMGDAYGQVKQAQDNYDLATIKIHQMMLSIAGFRANEGKQGWTNLNYQQKKFLPFNLDSWKKGELDFSINPRPLMHLTEFEQAEALRQQYLAYQAGVQAGFPIEWQLHQEGQTDLAIQVLERYQQHANDKQLSQQEQAMRTQAQVQFDYQSATEKGTKPPTTEVPSANNTVGNMPSLDQQATSSKGGIGGRPTGSTSNNDTKYAVGLPGKSVNEKKIPDFKTASTENGGDKIIASREND